MPYFRRSCWVVILALLAPLAQLEAGEPQQASETAPSHPRHSIGHKRTLKGVPQFVEVTPYLYRGGQPDSEGFRELAKMGITIDVDGRGSREHEREVVTKLGMEYVPIPWHCPFPKDEVFARFLTLLREHPGKKVFVHCRLGDDRVGMMIASYRMAEQGWTAEEAKREMKAFGFSSTHHLLCPGLSRYESSFPHRYKTSPAFASLRAERKSEE